MNFLKTTGLIQYIGYFLIYLIVINLIGVLFMYIDKKKAKYGRWRIQERTLILIRIARWFNRVYDRNVFV